jgi:hypothetical protein
VNNDKQTTHQIRALLDIILRQNYFFFHGQIYQPDKGVAMGSPISGTMAEEFLHLEKTIIKHPIDAKILSFYTRYVDDIFLIYDSTRTNPDNILQYIDTIHNSIQLSPVLESNNNVNFLDLSITRKPTCLGISIYRKPITTDTTNNFLSNQPLEHKMAAYWFLIRRMLTLPIDREQQYEEWQHILHITHINISPIPTNPVKTQNTAEHIPAKIPHPHYLKQWHKMGDLHVLITTDQESYQHLQAHQHTNCFQIK